MGIKDNFTDEEWRTLLRAPMLAAYAVAGASPNGQDYVREMAALAGLGRRVLDLGVDQETTLTRAFTGRRCCKQATVA